ncbi:hypothetical protein HK100_007447 [Physocladia obscura]|uniref:Uncharacterized protein n=1 Tax=Physocladia obscura TaxID=109957 RepID=A0AAD5T5E3_9FUNG|nr:hypothetical protein HK100_007447 [Physocladia obscura]
MNSNTIIWQDWPHMPPLYRSTCLGYTEFWDVMFRTTEAGVVVARINGVTEKMALLAVEDALGLSVRFAEMGCRTQSSRFARSNGVFYRGICGNRPIQWACESGFENVVALLLVDENTQKTEIDPVDASANNNYALRTGCIRGATRIVQMLLDRQECDPRACASAAIVAASARGHVKVLRLLLLDGRADPSVHENVCVRAAVEYGHVECVRLLVSDARVDAAVDGNYAYRCAVYGQMWEVVRVLEQDANVREFLGMSSDNGAKRMGEMIEEGEINDDSELSGWDNKRYIYDSETQLLFDSVQGVYCSWDAEEQVWIPSEKLQDDGHGESIAILRLAVQQSDVLPPTANTPITIDVDPREGITFARDAIAQRPLLRLKELAVSRAHARLFVRRVLSQKSGRWTDAACLIDLGSTHGCFVDGKRVSDKKVAGKIVHVSHNQVLTIGSTRFQIHVHREWPCAGCAGPLANQAHVLESTVAINTSEIAADIASLNVDLDGARRGELKKLKRQLVGPDASSVFGKGYTDRSLQRRKLHGSTSIYSMSDINNSQLNNKKNSSNINNPGPSAQSSNDQHILPNNRDQRHHVQQYLFNRHFSLEKTVEEAVSSRLSSGATAVPNGITTIPSEQSMVTGIGKSMLLKLGWKPGQGIGQHQENSIQTPIEPEKRDGRKGLGLL